LLNTVANKFKAPTMVSFIICTLTLLSPLSSTHVYAASPYNSGYDHGCSDAGISDPSEQYINEPGKGPSDHTHEFMGGYYAGFGSCSFSEQSNCDSSYPDVCIAPYPPDLDCPEISYKDFKVLSPDPHGFDKDNDGVGCES
jgi:hypothetical protein